MYRVNDILFKHFPAATLSITAIGPTLIENVFFLLAYPPAPAYLLPLALYVYSNKL